MIQSLTSSATSINRTRLPAVYSKASISSAVVFDYGCGKYIDHIREHLDRDCGAYLLPYDPFNQPRDVNYQSMRLLTNCIMHDIPVDVICSNVLNVIDREAAIKTIAWNIENIVRKTGGTGFVTVYEGDRSNQGRQTGPDQYQRNEPLRNYLRFFTNAAIKNGMIIVSQNA